MAYCPECGKQNDDSCSFCIYCGKKMSPENSQPEPEVSNADHQEKKDEQEEKDEKDEKKKKWLILAISILLLAAVGAGGFYLFARQSEPEPVIYMTNYDNMKVRSGPSPDYDLMDELPEGYIVSIDRTEKGTGLSAGDSTWGHIKDTDWWICLFDETRTYLSEQ